MIETWWVRHGQTVENVTRTVQGQLDGRLSSKGIEQAEKVADALKDIPFDFIYSSDLGRARETSRQIQEYHPRVQFLASPLLREKHFGTLQGKKVDSLDLGCSDPWRFIFTLMEGETPDEVGQRARTFLEELALHHQGQKVLVVSHGFLISCAINILLGEEICYNNLHKQENTAINYFLLDKDGCVVRHRLNSTGHL